MRHIFILAIAVLVLGGVGARYADRSVTAAPVQTASSRAPAYEAREPVSSGRSLKLAADGMGHFRTEARVGGSRMDFLVDSGASLVVLRESDAARAGLRPTRADYTATVSTANGKAKAAPVKLERVEVGGITVYDVRAMVMPDEALGVNLLGTAFLSQLKRYEVANGRMILEQ